MDPAEQPAEHLVDRLIATAGLAAPARAGVATAWQVMLETAHAAWPDVRIDPTQIVDFIAQRLTGTDLASALAAAPAADLVLAAACAHDEPTALAAFDIVLTEVDAAGASTRSPRDLIDDVKQLIRVQLLVAKDGKPPGITGNKVATTFAQFRISYDIRSSPQFVQFIVNANDSVAKFGQMDSIPPGRTTNIQNSTLHIGFKHTRKVLYELAWW